MPNDDLGAGSQSLAIFGGSFNPPHIAHVLAVSLVLSTEDIDEVIVIPTFQHPFAKALAPYESRIRMCELAFGGIPKVTVSRVEEELGGESRTLRTLEHLVALHPAARLRLVMGGDLVPEVDKWFRFDRIQELAPPLVVGRAGWDGIGTPTVVLPEVSSSDVRRRIAAHEWDALQSLVPRAVLAYVREHRLYEADPAR